MVHIGSGSVAVALVACPSQDKAEILYLCRESLVFRHTKVGGAEYKKITTALERHLSKLITEMSPHGFSLRRLTDIEIIFSAPIVSTVFLRDSFTTEKPREFTKAILFPIIAKMLSKPKREGVANAPRIPTEAVAQIGSPEIRTKLNGYEIINPLNKFAREIDITIHSHFVPVPLLQDIRAVFESKFPMIDISFSFLPRVSRRSIGIIVPEVSDFLVLIVESEGASLSVIKNNYCVYETVLNLGSNMFVRALAEELKVLPDIAYSYLTMESRGHASHALESRIQSVKIRIADEWLSKVRAALAECMTELFMPRRIFVVTEEPLGDFFLHLLKQEAAGRGERDESRSVTLLTAPGLYDRVSYAEHISHDSFMTLAALVHTKNRYLESQNWYDSVNTN